jgi:hypothetical protein
VHALGGEEAWMRVLAIDPGPVESAYVRLECGEITASGKLPNEVLLFCLAPADVLAIEMIASYGMPVGAEVFQTCVWVGRFVETWAPKPHRLIYRKDVKLHLCNSPRANDATVRQALIDRFGGKEKAIGTKRSQGPLYGVKGDVWQALAVAVTFADAQAKKEAA